MSDITDKVKESIRRYAIKGGIGLAVLGSTYCGAQEIEPIFNSLEVAITTDNGIRVRATDKIAFSTDKYQFTYHGLNETNSFNDYCGRNRLIAGKKGTDNQFIVDVTANQDRVKGIKAGIRNTSIPKKIGCYGFIDAEFGIANDGAHKPSASLVVGLGKDLAEKWAAEATFLANIEKKPRWYVEARVYRRIGSHIGVFGGIDAVVGQKPTYMAGCTFTR